MDMSWINVERGRDKEILTREVLIQSKGGKSNWEFYREYSLLKKIGLGFDKID